MNNTQEKAIENSSQPWLFDNLPKLVRPEAIAPILGLSVKTIYDWRYRKKQKNVPDDLFVKFNRLLFIRLDILERWVSSQNPSLQVKGKDVNV